MSEQPRASLRLPPQNVEAEQTVLGSLLLDPGSIVGIAPRLKPEDFYRLVHGLVYRAMLDIVAKEKTFDLVTLSDELNKRGQLEEVGGVSYLTTLSNMVPTPYHVEQYAKIVEQAAVLRRLIGVAGEIAGLAFEEGDDVDEIVDRAEELVAHVKRGRQVKAIRPLGAFLEEYKESVEQASEATGRMSGLPTGFIDLDAILGGLQKSDLIVIAGRPSSGKTGLALAMIENVLKEREVVILLFNLEMSGRQVGERIIGIASGLDHHQVRVGKVGKRGSEQVSRVVRKLKPQPILVYERAGITPSQLRSISQAVQRRSGLDLVVVDYLQLMSTARRMSRQEEVSYISRELKGLAMELDVPVLALSQLSRHVEYREDKRPVLADLRESGAIEQDADVVLMLYAVGIYDRESERKYIVEANVCKHRSGPTDTVYLFRDDRGVFHDLETAG